mmetsp:Transcript_124509/g.346618  ORF Transcript_124509/g.346618 Transcript_124509/m.346618 type:complete len:306 (-) Transcript_124509:133-1050(-)
MASQMGVSSIEARKGSSIMCPISRIPKRAQVMKKTTGAVSHLRVPTKARGSVSVQAETNREVCRAYDMGTGVCTSRSQRPTVCEREVTMDKSHTRSRLVKLSPWFRIDLIAFNNLAMSCKGRFLGGGMLRRLAPSMPVLRSPSLPLISDFACCNSCRSISNLSCTLPDSLARTCLCMAKGKACSEVRMTWILAEPASLRKSAILSAMSRQMSRMSFQIFRPSWKRWYAEFVLKTRRRLRPDPRSVCAASVGRPGIPSRQCATLTAKATVVTDMSGWRIRLKTCELGIPNSESSQSEEVIRLGYRK